MLLHSNKPQVLRLHNLEQRERQKFTGDFSTALGEVLPQTFNRKLRSSQFLMHLVTALPDLYYTLTTLLYCKRRLGEEYTYIAMYKQKHYIEEGVLLNRKTRVLLSILEIVSRNLIIPFFSKLMNPNDRAFEESSSQGKGKHKLLRGIWTILRKIKEGVSRSLGSAEEIMSSVEWLILMVYMLGWNKHFTFIESLLGITYVYTYKNDQIRDVSYAVEGYLLLATFLVKAVKGLYGAFTHKASQKHEPPAKSQPLQSSASKPPDAHKQRPLCRICYDEVKTKSSTKCGHVFCWSCIVKTLEMSPECPVCRTTCHPREVVQLRNG